MRRVSGSTIYNFTIIKNMKIQELLLSMTVQKFQNIRRDLIANVSHELRSPLTSITGFIETLQNEDVSKDQKSHFLTIMQEESNRMNRIIGPPFIIKN